MLRGIDRPRARLQVAICCLLLALGGLAHAAGPLKLELRPLAAQPRTGAPEWIEVRLDSSSVQLLEGVLELRVFDDSALAFTQRTPELALTTGTRAFRLLLPAAPRARGAMEREVRARFVTRSGDLDLGKFPLHMRLGAGQSFVLGIARPQLRGAGETAARFWQSLRPERFTPNGSASLLLTESMSTSPLILEPEELPGDPLIFCAFDALLLERGAFGELKKKPLAALGQWLAAGGSVALVAEGGFDVAHLETLRAWVKSDPAAPALAINADGRVQTKENAPLLARAGLGRLVVFPRVPENEAELDTPEWRRAAAFLWKFRDEQALAIAQEGHWNPPAASREPWRNNPYERAQVVQEFTEKLLPKSVRVIPLPVIVTILAAFIITVGPLDYFVLGKLRRRRLTWIVFPMVSVAFTALTVKLASHYLGTNTHRGAFILTDLAPDGRVVRETRIELVLPARPQELVRETQHALAAPLANADYRGNTSAGPSTFEGQFPARYTFRAPMQQWTPHLLRTTSLTPGEDHSRVNWGAFTGATSAPLETAEPMRGDSDCDFAFTSGATVVLAWASELSDEIVRRLTLRANNGPLPLFAHVSPTGASTLDDLLMLDPTDAHSTVVIAMRREGANLHAWRRLFLLP